MKTAIINGVLLRDGKVWQDMALLIENGTIRQILPADQLDGSDTQIIDVGGAYVSAGWIELHSHGIAGEDFMDADPDGIARAMGAYARHGVTGVFLTTLSAPFAEIRQALDAMASMDFTKVKGAAFLGAHLEGPYFSLAQRGAQLPSALSTPVDKEYEALLRDYPFIARIDTAPELAGSAEMAKYLRERGVICGIAHTDAKASQILCADEGDYPIATHLYSGMSGVHRENGFRYGGAIEACLLRDDIYCEAICDGIHLPAELLKLIYKVKGPERMILVTDSIRGADLAEEATFIMGNKQTGTPAVISEGVAWLPDRTAFAGSIATYDRLIRTAVNVAEIPLAQAVRMASETPAAAMKLPRKGKLDIGYDADITVFDKEVHVLLTMVGGTIMYEKKETIV